MSHSLSNKKFAYFSQVFNLIKEEKNERSLFGINGSIF